jgi:regulator of protease activity HflC (stomatin/prohibitin superfamily)
VKLGEALVRRSGLQARIGELHTRLVESARVQEGETPNEDPAALLAEFDRLANELEALIARVNRTNLSVVLADGRTLTDALARRDSLTLRHTMMRSLAEAAAAKHDRYSRTEIRVLSTIPVAEVRQRADDLARERRELDVAIQEANWANDLID